MRGTRVIRARRTELGAMAVIQRSRRRGTAIMSIAVASLVVTGCAGSEDAGAPGTAASPETTSFSPFEFTPTSEAGRPGGAPLAGGRPFRGQRWQPDARLHRRHRSDPVAAALGVPVGQHARDGCVAARGV